MRVLFVVMIFLCGVPGFSQDSWSAFLNSWAADDGPWRKQWTLLVRAGSLPQAWERSDDLLLRFWAADEMDKEPLDESKTATVREARRWDRGQNWLLLSRDGKLVADGNGKPTGEAVLAAIHGVGQQARFELLENFLHLHPERGDVIEAQLIIGLRLAKQRYKTLVENQMAKPLIFRGLGGFIAPPEKIGELADEVFSDFSKAMECLANLPDGWRISLPLYLRDALEVLNGSASPRLRAALARLQNQVLGDWQNNPNGFSDAASSLGVVGSAGPGALWTMAETNLHAERVPIFPSLDLAPGCFWPQDEILRPLELRAHFLKDWKGLLASCDGFAVNRPEGSLTSKSWKEYCHLNAQLSTLEMVAKAHLGRWHEATAALTKARRWNGKTPTEAFITIFRDPATPVEAETTLTAGLVPPADFFELLNRAPEPDLPNPQPIKPIYVVNFGKVEDDAAWQIVRQSQALSLWGPDELIWRKASQEDKQRVAKLGEIPDWAVFDTKGAILAAGSRVPDANLLATQLGAAGLTKLQRLNAFIQKHPSHLDARRERLALTRPRLPNSVLEPLVAEDAARTWTAITRGNDDPWRPEPALWQREAKNLLPELEAAVERWPRNASLWRTWLGWNALKADPKSVYQYASSIETWGDRHIWAGHLPHELHTAVGEELRKAKRFQDMREWFQMGWEGMRPHLIDFGFPDRAVAFKVILTNLQEALKNLEADDALSALEKQRTAVEKSLSKNK